MQVNAVGADRPQFIGPGRAKHLARVEEEAQVQNTSGTEAVPPEGETKEKGVVRLLQQGHFKGVADVRLRINFFDELEEAASAKTQAAAQEEIDTIVQSVQEGMSSYPETGELTEEELGAAVEGFEQAVGQAQAEYLAADSPSPESLVTGLSGAFDTLIAALTGPQAGEPAETDVEEGVTDDALADVEEGTAVAAAEANAEESTGAAVGAAEAADAEASTDVSSGDVAADEAGDALSEFITNLTSIFQAGLEDLTQALIEVGSLGEPSEPRGNGVAYEKFLAIYNQLLGNGTSEEAAPPEEEVDIEV